MRLPSAIRAALIAVIAFLGAGLSSAHADSGSVSLVIYKAGWFIGGSGGTGTLNFRGRNYALSTGGIEEVLAGHQDVAECEVVGHVDELKGEVPIGFVVLKAPDMPSILLEVGYVTNPDDLERLASDTGKTNIARGIRRAVEIHFARKLAER